MKIFVEFITITTVEIETWFFWKTKNIIIHHPGTDIQDNDWSLDYEEIIKTAEKTLPKETKVEFITDIKILTK